MELFSKSPYSLPWLPLFSTLLLVILAPLIFFFLKKQNQISKSKSMPNLPPGPPGLPIIGNIHQLGKIPHFSFWKLSQKYGPIMYLKLGQVPTVIVSSPQMAKEVMKTHDLECCSRPNSHGTSRLSYNGLDVAFCPYSDYWREIRKLCVLELLSVKRVRSFQHVRDEEISKLVETLSQAAHDPSNPIQLSEQIFLLVKAFISRIGLGRSYEGDQTKEGNFQETIDEVMVMMSSFWATDFFPSVGWIIDFLAGRRRRLEKCFHKFDEFYEKVIQEHLDPARRRSSHEDITDILISVSEDETSPIRLTKDHIKAVLMNIFIGAIDTSAVTIIWAMSELAKNPRVMKKVQTEIRSIIGKKPSVDENEVGKLKYMKMVVKEIFRLHPPATLLIPRETMQHCKIGGYDINSKTRIFVNAWAIGRHSWENPHDFYPERFEDSDIDYRGQHFELVPFGAGRRSCPGLTMASTSIELTLANLLHCFNWELPSGMKPEDINMEEEVGLSIHKKLPLYLVPVKYNWDE